MLKHRNGGMSKDTKFCTKKTIRVDQIPIGTIFRQTTPVLSSGSMDNIFFRTYHGIVCLNNPSMTWDNSCLSLVLCVQYLRNNCNVTLGNNCCSI